MMTQLKTKDKVAIFILILAGVCVAFYYLLFAPIQAGIKELKAKEEVLKKQYTEINLSIDALKGIDAEILASKIKAEKIKPSIEYTKDVIKLRQIMETEFLSYTDKNKTEYYAAYMNDSKKKPIITLSDVKEFSVVMERGTEKEKKPETVKLPYSVMDVKFYTKQESTNGLKDISALLEKIITKYHYMKLTSFSFIEPNAQGNDDYHYQVTMSIEIFLANGNFAEYVLGTCPNINDDGSICMEYNELFYSTCVKCKKNIDNCPNPNCNTLLTMDSGSCPVCKMTLKQCIECNELILISDKTCSKCARPQ